MFVLHHSSQQSSLCRSPASSKYCSIPLVLIKGFSCHLFHPRYQTTLAMWAQHPTTLAPALHVQYQPKSIKKYTGTYNSMLTIFECCVIINKNNQENISIC